MILPVFKAFINRWSLLVQSVYCINEVDTLTYECRTTGDSSVRQGVDFIIRQHYFKKNQVHSFLSRAATLWLLGPILLAPVRRHYQCIEGYGHNHRGT